MAREFYIIDNQKFGDQKKKEIITLIKEGEAVDEYFLKLGIDRAKMIVGCFDENKLIGVGVIKRPLESYKKRIFSESITNDDIRNYDFELGYLSVDKVYQRHGIASEIVRILLNQFNTNIFATTRHSGMRKILLANGFHESGKPYRNSNNNKLQLYVRRKL